MYSCCNFINYSNGSNNKKQKNWAEILGFYEIVPKFGIEYDIEIEII